MNKVANYLNEHLLGEVTTNTYIRQAFSTDASILSITPEMVVYPKTTNDIRKVARFSSQLAEKGHNLPITARGAGSDQTGAAIGKGVIVNTTAHMDAIFEQDTKQRLVRLQPGVMFGALNQALRLQGAVIPAYPWSSAYSTIGGAIANNASGMLSGKYGTTGDWVNQLEIVLSNGDILQTGRINKRELNRKKGQQNFEGEVYRHIDNLLTDKAAVIANIAPDARDNAGYSGIAQVKHKDGSIDLTPLFVGSQGTLGIISEVIMKTDIASNISTCAFAFSHHNEARDAADILRKTDPCLLEYIDSELFESALETGKTYPFVTAALEKGKVAAVLLVGYDDVSERARAKKQKRAQKLLQGLATSTELSRGTAENDELLGLRSVGWVAVHPTGLADAAVPPLLDGAYIPAERLEDFMAALEGFKAKFSVTTPLYGRLLDNIFYLRPILNIAKVSERQKTLKIIDAYATLVNAHNGCLIGEAGEGRLKTPFACKELDTETVELYEAIKDIFDPLGILNPGVKQKQDLKSLAGALRSSYSLSAFAPFAPLN